MNLLDRRSDLLVTQIDVLRDAVRRVRARVPFRIDAWGRPSRSYALPVDFGLWTLPQGDADFPGRWRTIKTAFVIPTGANADSPCPALSRARLNATGRLLPLPLFGQAHQEDLISFLEGVLPKASSIDFWTAQQRPHRGIPCAC